jgi:hypothetical protein
VHPNGNAGNFLIFFGSCCLQLQRSWPKDGQESMHLRLVRLLVFFYPPREKRETIDIAHAVRGFLSVKALGHPA